MLLIFVNSLMLLIGYELNVSINYLKSKKKDTQLGEIINNPQLVKSKRK
jgi:hypothetical protein